VFTARAEDLASAGAANPHHSCVGVANRNAARSVGLTKLANPQAGQSATRLFLPPVHYKHWLPPLRFPHDIAVVVDKGLFIVDPHFSKSVAERISEFKLRAQGLTGSNNAFPGRSWFFNSPLKGQTPGFQAH
jgi:hypothetical protein